MEKLEEVQIIFNISEELLNYVDIDKTRIAIFRKTHTNPNPNVYLNESIRDATKVVRYVKLPKNEELIFKIMGNVKHPLDSLHYCQEKITTVDSPTMDVSFYKMPSITEEIKKPSKIKKYFTNLFKALLNKG